MATLRIVLLFGALAVSGVRQDTVSALEEMAHDEQKSAFEEKDHQKTMSVLEQKLRDKSIACEPWAVKIMGMKTCPYYKEAVRLAQEVHQKCSKVEVIAKAVPGQPHNPPRNCDPSGDWFNWLGPVYWTGDPHGPQTPPACIGEAHAKAKVTYGEKEAIPGYKGADASAHRTSPFVTVDRKDNHGEQFIGGYSELMALLQKTSFDSSAKGK